MSALAKIKKAAAQHEQDRQYDKALAQYARLLDGEAGSDDEVDVTLYNRAGDLALRAGDVPRAVTYFERAIDLYAAGGFLNNAVALAVKILRHAPGHLAAHHTLGALYARKGFRAEARQHLAEYAAQMHRAARADEVRRTLAELAALGANEDEVTAARELLATRAAGPDDAGALVRGFDDALGSARARPSAERPAAVASVPLSELIELEVRGPHRTPAAVPPAPRWTLTLPGDPAPLRLSALRDQPASSAADRGELNVYEPFDLGSDTELTMLDLSTGSPASGIDDRVNPLLDLDAPDGLDLLGTAAPDAFGAESFEVEPFAVDVPAFDVPPFENVPAANGVAFAAEMLDLADVESRHLGQLHAQVSGELAAALPSADGAALAAPALEAAGPADEGTDLGEWLRSTTRPASTRLVTPALGESGDEAADFDATLAAFTSGIAQSLDAGDRESHYDLGVAFRGMGLLSDAVREFQCALSAPGAALREREALAQCFLDLGRAELALVTLEQAAADAARAGAAGGTLVGVHYVLAESARAVGRAEDARAWYVRVLATDYGFRDAAARLAALPPPRTPAATR